LIALLGFVVVLLAAAGCGMALLGALRVYAEAPAERFALGSAVGLGVLAYAVLAAGLLGWLRPGVLAALVLIEAVIGARALVGWAASGVQVFRCSGVQVFRTGSTVYLSTRTPGYLNTERLIAAALVAFCLLVVGWTLVGALAPPNGDDWDSLAYHLAAPKIYLAHGRIGFVPYDSHTNFPFTLEMLYTVGLAYGGAAGAKLFHWAMGWLTALSVAAFCRRLASTSRAQLAMPAWGPPLAAALFLGIPQVQWQATTAYIDLGTTLYQFLALAAFVAAVSGADAMGARSLSWLIVSGMMSGWAMGTKMTAMLPFGLLLLAGAIWAASGSSHWTVERDKSRAHPDPGHQPRWLGVAVMALVGVVIACPWYIKSYVWTNNPVYPFFYHLFPHSIGWTPEAERAYRLEQMSFGLDKGLRGLLMAPWNLAMQGWAFFTVLTLHAPAGTLPYFDGLQRGGISAAFLGLVPLALFTRRWDRRLTGLLLYSLALLLPWFVLSQQSRYLLPVTAPLAVVAAVMAANLEVDLTRWAASVFVGVTLLLHAGWGWHRVFERSFPVVSGQVSRDDYLRRTFQAYEASKFVNTLPPGSKVALFQEARGFYIDRDYLWANPLQNTLIPYHTLRDGAELTRFLKTRLGVTHVMFNRAGAAGSKKTEWYQRLQDAIDDGHLVPLHASHEIEIYAIAD
jgi:hypothetical protein